MKSKMMPSIITMVIVLFAFVTAIGSAAAVPSATRTLPASVAPGEEFQITISYLDIGMMGQVNETLPDGFTYMSSSLSSGVVTDTNWVKFTLLGGTSFTYNVTASDVAGTYTFSGTVKDEDKNVTVVGGNISVTISAAPPTLVTYTITNTMIIPPQTTSIDVAFSETMSYRIAIEKAGATIYDWTGTATNPTAKVWDGTYEPNGTQVPDGVYTVNVSGVSTTTGLSVVNTSKTITVGVTPTVSIGSAEGSVGDTVDVSINITDASRIGAMDIRVTYDPSILNATNVANGSMIENLPDLLWASNVSSEGELNISLAIHPGMMNGTGELFVVTFDIAGGNTGDSSTLAMNVMGAWTGDVSPQPVTVSVEDGYVTVGAHGTPFSVGGHVYYPNATIVSGADVTVTNLNTSESLTTTTDSNGAYVVSLGNLPSGHIAGDTIQVTATYNGMTGTNSAPRSENLSDSPQIIDVTIAQAVQIRAANGGDLPANISVGDTFTVLITEDGSPVGAGTNVAFRLPHDTGDPVYVSTDADGKAQYKPLITGTLGIKVLDGTVTVAEATVNVVTVAEDTVTRDLPSTADAGNAIAVNLTVDVESGATFYAIDETVPSRWTVTSATSGGDYTAEAGHVKWVVTSGATDTVYSYTVLVPADASGTYTFDGIYAFEGMTTDAVILGDTTVNVSVSPPTLVTYTITNTTITPPQTTSIDVRFSEQVSAIIKIEDASGNLVNELYTSSGVTDPTPKTWVGTYTNDTTVPDGTYTVNVSGVSTTTGLSVVNTSKTITVGVTPTVSIGSAEGSVGDTVDVSINITDASRIGAMDISVTYDASILNATNVANGSMIENLPSPLVACNLIPGAINISSVTYPDAIDGDGELFVVTFDVVGGDDNESSVLDIAAEAYTTDVPPQYVPVDTADGFFVVNNSSAVSTVSFDPLDSRTYMGSTTTVNLTLDSVPDGLSGYNLTVSLSDQSIAEILSVSFPAWATLHDNSTFPADAVWLKAADLVGSVGSGDTNIPLGTLTIRGDAKGVCDIVVTVTKMDDDNGDPIDPYTVSGTINVTSVIALPDHDNSPTDPDSDGLYEDLNGNGRIDFDDAVQYFKYMEWIEVHEPVSCFDFNGNGRIDFDDIVKLFGEV